MYDVAVYCSFENSEVRGNRWRDRKDKEQTSTVSREPKHIALLSLSARAAAKCKALATDCGHWGTRLQREWQAVCISVAGRISMCNVRDKKCAMTRGVGRRRLKSRGPQHGPPQEARQLFYATKDHELLCQFLSQYAVQENTQVP